jgi:tetratricopeptide (TPR) repeat protein
MLMYDTTIRAASKVVSLSALVLLAVAPSAAEAQDTSAAARAFSNGQAAELSGDYGRAAELYELADRISPTKEALRSAARMRKKTGDTALAATHAEALLRRYPGDSKSKKLAEEILKDAQENLGRYQVICTPRCEVEADGFAIGVESRAEHVLFLEPGEHELVAAFPNGTSSSKTVEAEAGEKRQFRFEQSEGKAPAGGGTSGGSSGAGGRRGGPPRPPQDEGGLHPGWFLGATAITLGLGATTVWSGIDTENLADEYQQDRTRALYDEGKDSQLRTNILIGATAAAGVATGLIGIFWTDWDGSPDGEQRAQSEMPDVRFGASPSGASMTVQGRF